MLWESICAVDIEQICSGLGSRCCTSKLKVSEKCKPCDLTDRKANVSYSVLCHSLQCHCSGAKEARLGVDESIRVKAAKQYYHVPLG